MLGGLLSKAAVRARLTGDGSSRVRTSLNTYTADRTKKGHFEVTITVCINQNYKSVFTEEKNQKKTKASGLKEPSFSFLEGGHLRGSDTMLTKPRRCKALTLLKLRVYKVLQVQRTEGLNRPRPTCPATSTGSA